MLVLTVKVGERVYVGECVITVLEKSGQACRLGFAAPDHVVIVREKAKLEREKQAEQKNP